MLKKIISILVCTLMLASVFSVSAASFKDMTSSYSWASDAVDTLSKNGIINGYPDGTFKPGNNITKEEAISLFARTLGSSEPLNKSVVSLAGILYEESLAKFDTYAKEAASYLLYKKVLTESELSTYLSASNKSQTLKRYEAAALIAKCLGGDIWLKSNPNVTLSYADAADVPAAAKGYVYFASEAQIITGMENNKFVPMGNVTRAQIATMIHRIFDRMAYTYTEGMISNINDTTGTVTIRTADGEAESYIINKNVAVMVDGAQAGIDKLKIGQEVVLTFSNDALYSVDVVNLSMNDTFLAVYKGKTVETNGTKVKFTTIDDNEAMSYFLSDNVVVSYNEESSSINELKTGDYVKVTVDKGKITVIEAEPKNKTISGTVDNITYDPDVVISVKTANMDVMELAVKAGATITKNSKKTTFSELVIGDTVELTLEYGKIASVKATGISKKTTGEIEEITISKTNSTVKIKNGDDVTAYVLSRDVKITVDGEAATLYDLRLGYTVEIETSSSTITEITVKSIATPLQITGQITLINTTYDMIRVTYVDYNGSAKEATIFVKGNAKILDSNDGKMKTLSQLKVGQNITAAGMENVGVFEATSIMILSNTN